MFPFSNAPYYFCDGIYEKYNLISKNLGYDSLLVLELSIALEHSNEFWVYQLWIIGVATDTTI